jgi:NAD(P)-dependent dehydrogenase (short-subunit alcohol dehydrogenase family)
LAGKVAVITGASAGVGAATARLFVAEGAQVVLAARTPGPLQEIADELGGLAVPTDVSKRAELQALVEAAVRQHSRIDILVNNAGTNVRGNFGDITADGVEQVIDTNLKAPMLLTHMALPYLRATKGVVVNVASIAGHLPLPGEASYCASKWGLRGFTFAVDAELRGTGVSLCAVSPGPISTGFILNDLDHTPDLVFSQPFLTAEQVGQAVLDCVLDRKRERAMPASTLFLAKLIGMFPRLQEVARPILERKGARVKAQFRKQRTG